MNALSLLRHSLLQQETQITQQCHSEGKGSGGRSSDDGHEPRPSPFLEERVAEVQKFVAAYDTVVDSKERLAHAAAERELAQMAVKLAKAEADLVRTRLEAVRNKADAFNWGMQCYRDAFILVFSNKDPFWLDQHFLGAFPYVRRRIPPPPLPHHEPPSPATFASED